MKLLFSKTNFVFTYKLSKEHKSNDGNKNLTIRNHYIIVINQALNIYLLETELSLESLIRNKFIIYDINHLGSESPIVSFIN